MKRIVFYPIIIFLAFIACLVLGQWLMAGKNFGMAGPAYFLIFIFLPVFIISFILSLIYEFLHPINNNFSELEIAKNRSSYKVIIGFLTIIVLWTLITIIIYLLPIITNLKYINSTSWHGYDTRYYLPNDFSLNTLLLYKYIFWRYILLLFSLISLFLATKMVKFVNIFVFLVIVLIIIMEFTKIGFLGNSESINYSKYKTEKLIGIYNSNIAVDKRRANLCDGDFIDKSLCIKKVAFKNNDPELCLTIDVKADVQKKECLAYFSGK